MDRYEKQPRTTPVDGYDVVEQPEGVFTVKAKGMQVGDTFASFASAYMFIQRKAQHRDQSSAPAAVH